MIQARALHERRPPRVLNLFLLIFLRGWVTIDAINTVNRPIYDKLRHWRIVGPSIESGTSKYGFQFTHTYTQ